jgi:16S rRNA (cytidine1402-2'-O)-methyltransferase
MAKLFIVGTPIGNISDISLRALAVLKEADLILSEDTRVIKKVLDHYQIKTPTLSYHQHSRLEKSEEIASLLKKGKNLALVSDAGTPGISDPGNKLIHFLIAEKNLQIEITVVSGPSALTSAASISGFPMDKFVFLGFPPAKKKRKKLYEEAANLK